MKPKAVELAEILEHPGCALNVEEEAAHELRRLAALNDEMLFQLEHAVARLEMEHMEGSIILKAWIGDVRATIAKAKSGLTASPVD